MRKGDNHNLQCLPSGESTTCTEALLPRKCLHVTHWWEVEKKNLFSFLFTCATFHFYFTKLPYFNLLVAFNLFSVPVQLRRGDDRVAWWTRDIQSRSTHHSVVILPQDVPGQSSRVLLTDEVTPHEWQKSLKF